MERLQRRRPLLEFARRRLELGGERELEPVQEPKRVLAHDDYELGLDDVDLARKPRGSLLLIAAVELEAVGAVDRHRVDVQPLERLQDRLTRAAEERHALLQLRVLRPELQQEDVAERVAGPKRRHTALP